MPRLSSSILIQADRDTVFRILRDIENYPRYFRYIRGAHIVADEGDTVVADIDESIHGITQRLRNRFRFYPPVRVEAEQIKGPFRSARAQFTLEETPNGTRLEHLAEFEIGRGLLGKVIHRFVADAFAQQRMAEEMVAIRQAAEMTAKKDADREGR